METGVFEALIGNADFEDENEKLIGDRVDDVKMIGREDGDGGIEVT